MGYYYRHHSSGSVPWQFVVLLLILCFVLLFIQSCSSSNNYNNGVCRVCGGHYEFQNTVGHAYTTNYVYKCDKCGNLIETNSYYNSLDLD